MKYYIIAYIENEYSDRTESFNHLSEAQRHLEFLKDPNCLDPYYQNLINMGGDLRIEDENGNGY